MLIAAIQGICIPSRWHVAHSTPMMYGWYHGYGHTLHPSIWCLPCLTGIMVPFILWDGMLHPLMRPQYRYYTPSLHGVHHAIRCADSPFMACHRVSISPIA